MTHAETIALFRDLGAKFTPDLKSSSVEMPFNRFSQEDYAQKLVDEYKAAGYSPQDPTTWPNTMADIKGMGINFIAPPLWTLERSGPLVSGGGWYYQSVTNAINTDGDYFAVLNVLA